MYRLLAGTDGKSKKSKKSAQNDGSSLRILLDYLAQRGNKGLAEELSQYDEELANKEIRGLSPDASKAALFERKRS